MRTATVALGVASTLVCECEGHLLLKKQAQKGWFDQSSPKGGDADDKKGGGTPTGGDGDDGTGGDGGAGTPQKNAEGGTGPVYPTEATNATNCAGALLDEYIKFMDSDVKLEEHQEKPTCDSLKTTPWTNVIVAVNLTAGGTLAADKVCEHLMQAGAKDNCDGIKVNNNDKFDKAPTCGDNHKKTAFKQGKDSTINLLCHQGGTEHNTNAFTCAQRILANVTKCDAPSDTDSFIQTRDEAEEVEGAGEEVKGSLKDLKKILDWTCKKLGDKIKELCSDLKKPEDESGFLEVASALSFIQSDHSDDMNTKTNIIAPANATLSCNGKEYTVHEHGERFDALCSRGSSSR